MQILADPLALFQRAVQLLLALPQFFLRLLAVELAGHPACHELDEILVGVGKLFRARIEAHEAEGAIELVSHAQRRPQVTFYLQCRSGISRMVPPLGNPHVFEAERAVRVKGGAAVGVAQGEAHTRLEGGSRRVYLCHLKLLALYGHQRADRQVEQAASELEQGLDTFFERPLVR